MDKEDLFKAILAMDAYNRGYDASITLPDDKNTSIGNAKILITSSSLLGENGLPNIDKPIGFYALSYDYNGETVIAYRGTDYPEEDNPIKKDIFHGWSMGGGNIDSAQAQMAVDFYREVVKADNSGNDIDPRIANVSLTGHSLGGGLAGYIAGLYHKEATVFDSMTYELAAKNTRNKALEYKDEMADGKTHFIIMEKYNDPQLFRYYVNEGTLEFYRNNVEFTILEEHRLEDLYASTVYQHSGLDILNAQIWDPDFSQISGYHVKHEVLDLYLQARSLPDNSAETEDPIYLGKEGVVDLDLIKDVPWYYQAPFEMLATWVAGGAVAETFSIDKTMESIALHSQASLVIRQYADAYSLDENWQDAAEHFWPVFYKDDFAGSILNSSAVNLSGELISQEKYADTLRMVVAYSAIQDGVKIFGDTGIVALYDDANELGAELIRTPVPAENAALVQYAPEISQAFVEYAGRLALNKIEDASMISIMDVKDGVVQLGGNSTNNDTLTIDFTDETWSIARQDDDTFNTVEDIVSRTLVVDKILNDQANTAHVRAVMKDAWGTDQADVFDRVIFAMRDNANVNLYQNAVESKAATLVASATYNAGTNRFYGDESDTLYLIGDTAQTAVGGLGDEIFYGGDADTTMYGGYGSDYFLPGLGNDTIVEVSRTYEKNIGYDVLDLSTIDKAMEVNLYQRTEDGVYLDKGYEASLCGASGAFDHIEFIKMGDRNDHITLGSRGGLSGEYYQTRIDAGDGIDRLEIFSDSLYMKDGIAHVAGRRQHGEVENIETIILTGSSTNNQYIGVDQVYGQQYFHSALSEFDDQYLPIFDYSSVDTALTVHAPSNRVSDGINTDHYIGKYVGTHHGDTIYTQGGTFVLGTGNDVVELEYKSPPDDWPLWLVWNNGGALWGGPPTADNLPPDWPNDDPLATVGDYTGDREFVEWSRGNSLSKIYYMGGDDVVNNLTYGQAHVYFPDTISVDDLNISYSGSYGSQSITVDVAGMGRVTLNGIDGSNYGRVELYTGADGARIIPTPSPIISESTGTARDTILNGYGPVRTVNVTSPNLIGTDEYETLYAKQNEDSTLIGLGGNDGLYGGFANDTLIGGEGNDTIRGHFGDDIIEGNEGNDTIYGEFGQDTINPGLGSDTVRAGFDDDILFYDYDGSESGVTDIYFGGSGHDILNINIGETDFISLQAEIDRVLDWFESVNNPQSQNQSFSLVSNGSSLSIFDIEEINVFRGIALYRSVGDQPDEEPVVPPALPVADLALDLSGSLAFRSLPDSVDVNTGAQDKKTHSLSFETGADVNTAQVVYEQGGSTRGISFIIENGSLFAAVWNKAEENWGFKELQASVAANTKYTATLVMDGARPADGTVALYVNGGEVDTISGVGRLYKHGDDIGIGQIAGGTLLHNASVPGNAQFTGSIEKLAHYNAALNGQDLSDLHDYMGHEWLDGGVTLPVNTDPIAQDDNFTGDEDVQITGNVLSNDSDADGDPLNVVAGTFTSVQGGSIVLQTTGDFMYTPTLGFFGSDSVSYILEDGRGGSDTAAINFTVNEVVPPIPEAPTDSLVFLEEGGVSYGYRANGNDINTGSYLEKTHSMAFETGADVTSTQMLYEQGGSVRGLSLFIEGGKLYAAVWNKREENWGYKEVNADIEANTSYTASFVMDGVLPNTGAATLYLNGSEIGDVAGVGRLYGHSGNIYVGSTGDNTVIHNAASSADNPFTGTIEKMAHYNAALSGAELDKLHDFMAHEFLPSEPPLPSEDVVLEFGTIDADHNEVAVDLDNSFDNPVVFVTMTSFNNAEVAVARITDIQSDSFTFSAQEAGYLGGVHGLERFSYIVAEAGSWALTDGTLLEIGTHDTNVLHRNGFDAITYDSSFAGRPAVMTHVQTDNDAVFVGSRQRNVGTNGFSLALQEEEATQGGSHGTETIGWIAIDQGAGSDDGFDFFAHSTADNHTHTWRDIVFDDHLDTLPQLIANISSNDGGDASFLRADNLGTNRASISIQEDTSNDNEIAHTTETIDFFAIEGQGQLTGTMNNEIV